MKHWYQRHILLAVGIMVGIGVVLAGAVVTDSNLFAQASVRQLEAGNTPRYYDQLPSHSNGIANYVIGARWDKNPVTYSILNCPTSLDCGQAQEAVRQAAETWDAACGLRLDEVTGSADIEISWQSGSHGDGYPFDGPGNVLGHSFFPLSYLGSLAGDVHLDNAETWVVGNPTANYQVHLPTTVLHELGHALGLDHSSDPNALMWEEYVGVRGLTQDDINGIQALYGPPSADEGQASAPAPAEPTGVTATAGNSAVRMRSGPGTRFSRVGSLPAGASAPVLGRNAAGDWLYIEYSGVRGWVAGWLCIITGDLNSVPVVDQNGNGAAPAPPSPQPPSNPGEPTGITATATTTLRIRSGPGTGYSQVGTMPARENAPVLGRSQSSRWLLVNYNGTQGWVAAWLVIVNGNLDSVPVVN